LTTFTEASIKAIADQMKPIATPFRLRLATVGDAVAIAGSLPRRFAC